MTTDHSAFIARHHRTAVPDDTAARRRVKLLWLAMLGATGLYAGLCMFFILYLRLEQREVITAAAASILLACIVTFAIDGLRTAWVRRREHKLLRSVLEGSRGARLVTDESDHTVYYNDKFSELCAPFGPPVLETFSRLFENNQDMLAHFSLLAEQAHRGLTDSIELCYNQGDNETWYRLMAQPVAGHAGYIHWRIDDITLRRSADRGIREEREKLIDFTDNAPVGFFSVDEQGRFVFVNATLARWLGEDIQTMLRMGHLHTYLLNPPEDGHPYDILPSGGAKQMAEVKMKGPGGRPFDVSISLAVVHEGPGIVRTRGVVHDLTAERAMRQALQASEDRFVRFFDEAPLGIAMMDSQGLLDDCNPALAAMLGYKVEDIEGRHFEALAHDADRDAAVAALAQIEKGGQMKAPFELTLVGRDREVAVQMFARRLEGSENIVLHFTDMSEQKALEQQFVQSQKMQAIGQLAGGVAHDFNNLLTAIIGFCDLLLLRHKPGDSSFADIMQIKQNSNRAANLVRQLLAFSRQQTLRPKVQDLSDILNETSHLLRRLIGANIDLELVHGQGQGLVKVDLSQMEQVLINLAVNARDAMENGGKLTIRTHNFNNKKPVERGGDEMPPGHWVVLEVEDTGCGIPPDIIGRIFEPFFTTKEVGQGTGLGLATVYGIVRQTGGYLHVTSDLGRGTTFSIYLPRANEIDAEEEAQSKTPDEEVVSDLTGTATIMLVEDEDAVRVFAARALANKGYEVIQADCGENAIDVFAENAGKKIDLLITDVIMPNMDGPTLAKQLREKVSDLKIVFISGYTEEKLKDHMGKNIWFLPKPFTLKQLAEKVKEALEE